MERKIGVALIGCGGMGRQHLEALGRLGDFRVLALCDVSAEALRQVGEQYQVAARYQDYEQLLAEVKPDIAAVVTQTRGHLGPTLAALRQGVSVLCEKPIAIDLAEADQMVAAAAASGAKLAINQQNHLHPAITRAVELVAEGLIGEVLLVRGRNKAGRRSGNEFMEMGTHVTDMMLRFGGTPAWCAGSVQTGRRLAEVGDIMEAKEMSPRDRDSGLVVGDRAMAHYGFADGMLGEIHFLDHAATFNGNYGVDLIGREGQLAVRVVPTGGEHLWHLPRPMEGAPGGEGQWRAVPLPAAPDPMVLMYRGLAAAIEQNTEAPDSGEQGRWAFEMILAIYQSHREGGRRVPLPLPDRRHPLEQWRLQAAQAGSPKRRE